MTRVYRRKEDVLCERQSAGLGSYHLRSNCMKGLYESNARRSKLYRLRVMTVEVVDLSKQ